MVYRVTTDIRGTLVVQGNGFKTVGKLHQTSKNITNLNLLATQKNLGLLYNYSVKPVDCISLIGEVALMGVL